MVSGSTPDNYFVKSVNGLVTFLQWSGNLLSFQVGYLTTLSILNQMVEWLIYVEAGGGMKMDRLNLSDKLPQCHIFHHKSQVIWPEIEPRFGNMKASEPNGA
jgi:hypothetical protein